MCCRSPRTGPETTGEENAHVADRPMDHGCLQPCLEQEVGSNLCCANGHVGQSSSQPSLKARHCPTNADPGLINPCLLLCGCSPPKVINPHKNQGHPHINKQRCRVLLILGQHNSTCFGASSRPLSPMFPMAWLPHQVFLDIEKNTKPDALILCPHLEPS